MAKFNKLDVPHQWKDEFTKYPHGYTIFEALCKWVKQVDNMVDNINNWNDYLDNFVENFEFELQEEVQSTIEIWQSEGLLDDIIESALNTGLAEKVDKQELDKRGVDVTNHGVIGDGNTFNRLALQEVINNYRNIYIPDGVYMIDIDTTNEGRRISIPSNTRIEFSSNAILKLAPHNNTHYEILDIRDVSNVQIINPNIDGSREDNISTTGEWGMGISVRGSKNVTINNPNIKNCWGDGLYIGESGTQNYCENIRIINPICKNNRRQGISIISVKGLRIIDPKITETNGTAPQAAIDIEPNSPNDFLQDIVIENMKTRDNIAGLKIYLWAYSDSPNPVSITVKNLVSEKDVRGIHINGGKDIKGFINVDYPVVLKSLHNGMMVLNYGVDNPKITINRPYIENPNTLGQAGPNNGSAIRITKDSNADFDSPIGNIEIIEPTIVDTRTPKLIDRAIYCINSKDQTKAKNISIIDPIRLDTNTTMLYIFADDVEISDKYGVLTENMNNISKTVQPSDYRILYTTKGNTTTKAVTISSLTQIGTELEFLIVTPTTLRLELENNQEILTIGEGTVIGTEKGSRLKIKKITNLEWVIVNKVGEWTLL